ncbi:hypothetical protein GWN91_08050 [Candidatus Saccharibacteria bacterium]|nr:hypothetical protein [Candidatus Saccharibacteria bacterium]NIV73110.1 hypothetical protein [Calditrichia bacterium]NIW80789.1 hypothetical protein [Calditrichia bacterium]
MPADDFLVFVNGFFAAEVFKAASGLVVAVVYAVGVVRGNAATAVE